LKGDFFWWTKLRGWFLARLGGGLPARLRRRFLAARLRRQLLTGFSSSLLSIGLDDSS
jgi:hypothetical protein